MSHVPDADTLGKIIGACIREAVTPIIARLDDLERSIANKGIRFTGRFNRDITNERGDICSHGGSLWIALRKTTDMPGAGSDWTRMLTADKRGNFTHED
jgi:hypothetical protein